VKDREEVEGENGVSFIFSFGVSLLLNCSSFKEVSWLLGL
jgi:hypothetical protein